MIPRSSAQAFTLRTCCTTPTLARWLLRPPTQCDTSWEWTADRRGGSGCIATYGTSYDASTAQRANAPRTGASRAEAAGRPAGAEYRPTDPGHWQSRVAFGRRPGPT